MPDYSALTKVQPSDPKHLVKLLSVLGTHELPGKAVDPLVAEMLAGVGLVGVQDDTTAWCSAAANWAMHQTGQKGSGSAAARSWLLWGHKVPLERVMRGDVVILSRPGASWQGHVAFYLGKQDGKLALLGGNQNNAVSVSLYVVDRLLGIRRAVPVDDITPTPKAENLLIKKEGRAEAGSIDLRGNGLVPTQTAHYCEACQACVSTCQHQR